MADVPTTIAPRSYAKDIETAAQGEPILEVVILGPWWGDHADDRAIDPTLVCRLLTWEQTRPLLDRPYDPDRAGARDCPRIYAWTDTTVLVTNEHEGATTVDRFPRYAAPSGALGMSSLSR
jgi:hypothetical protein